MFSFIKDNNFVWSIPVPIVAMIPAMLGKSKFQLMKEAIPRMIIISDMLVINKAIEDFIFFVSKKNYY